MADQSIIDAACAGSTAQYAFTMFGRFAGRRVGDGADVTPRGRKARALLAYLLLERKPFDRDRVAGLLWSERGQAQAHASLRQCLLELRGLAQQSGPLLAIGRHQVAAGAAVLDLDEMAACAPRGDTAALAAAFGGGDALLEDLDGLDPAFDQWLRAQRAGRGEALLSAAREVCRTALGAGKADGALRLAGQLQRIDPLDERAARFAMEAAHALGEQAEMHRVYDTLRKTLRDELGADPAPETRALRDRLAAAAAMDRAPAPPARTPPPPDGAAPAPTGPLLAPRKRRLILLSAAVLLLAAILIGIWRWQAAPDTPTVAVIAQQGPGADMLARELGLDLARLANARPDQLSVVDSAGGVRSDYIVRVGSERIGDRVSADLSLLVRGNSELLWSARFERPGRQLSDLREQMSAKLGSVLLCATDPRHAPARLDRAARRLFLAACDQLDEPPSEQRRALLRQLTQRAPDFAWGWAMLAFVEADMATPILRSRVGISREAANLLASARAHLLRARTLDPTLGGIYMTEAILMIGPSAWGDRLAIVERGLAADPEYAPLHEERANYLPFLGRNTDAVASARRAVELNPLSPWSRSRLVISLAYAGNVPGAWRELAAAERIWPGAAALRDARFRLELRYGDPRNALRIIEMDETRGIPGDSSHAGERAFLLARIDPSPANVAAALRPYDMLRRRTRFISPSYLQALVQFGRVEEAYRLLEPGMNLEALQWGSDTLFRPHMRAFRNDRRFMPLMARLGLLQYWQESGQWPDFCMDPELPNDCRAEARRLLRGDR